METVTCPPQYSIQELMRPPGSLVDKINSRLRHRAARKQFEQARRVPMKSLEEVFPGLADTRAAIRAAVPSETAIFNMPINELVTLTTLCAYCRPKNIFEFGTFDGLTTLHLAMNSGPDCRVTTIDLPPDDPIRKMDTPDTFLHPHYRFEVGGVFHGTEEEKKITQIFCNTTQFDHADFRGTQDFIFIDAGHDYSLVKSDTNKALDMIAPGGVILWHDYYYMYFGVYTWLNELSAERNLMNVPGTALVYYRHPEK